jgi:hypothetical protein
MVAHLRDLGWDIDVVTIREEDTEREVGPIDTTLLDPSFVEEVYRTRYTSIRNSAIRMKNTFRNAPTRIFGTGSGHSKADLSGPEKNGTTFSLFQRVKNLVTEEILAFPDRHSGWIWGGYRTAQGIVREKGTSVVFASGPPHSTLVIGYLLKKQFGLPLVLELRDPWVGNPYHDSRSSPFSRLERGLQGKVLRAADHIRASTNRLKEHILSLEPTCRGKISVGGAGFPEYVRSMRNPRLSHSVGPFTVTHAGTLYEKRKPNNFLCAARNLILDGTIPSATMRIQFLGKADIRDPVFWKLLEDPHLASIVRTDMLSHSACIQAMVDSDLLVAFQQGTTLQIPAKVYEYLSLGRPMLTVSDIGSATWELIRREGFGACVADNVEEITQALREMYSLRTSHMEQRFYPNAEKYSFRTLSRRLSDEMNQLLVMV